MEGKALYFPGTRNIGQFTRKLDPKHFFDPSKNGVKFKYHLPANPDPPSQARRATPAETIPTKAEENKCSSDIGKITQEKGTFFVILRCSNVFFPD